MTPEADMLADAFGQIDVYLFDQLLRGRIRSGMRVLDAGCGNGRNVHYLLRAGYEVFAADAEPECIASVRRLASALAPALPPDNFRVESVEAMSFPTAHVDVVVCVAVLHFARDEAHWEALLQGTWRVLRPGGLYFARLASTIGMERQLEHLGGRRYHLPDGTDRYLVDAPTLADATERLGGTLVDPLRTSLVQDQRAMTTWVMRKGA